MTTTLTSKQPYEEYAVGFDFTTVLGTETVSSVIITAIDRGSLADVTASLLDDTKETIATSLVYGWVRNGLNGHSYLLTCKIVGSSDTHYEIESILPVADVPADVSLNYKLGDSKSTSYVSVAFADTYFSQRGGSSSWTTMTTEAKQNALVQAAREIDMNNFMGNKYYDSQKLQFPRDDHEVYVGACASPTTTSFKGSNLWSSTYNKIPTDYFVDGTVHITSGTSKGDTRVIASSNNLNGMVHVASAFTATLDTTSNYLVFAPVEQDIAKAQCEQVLYILDSGLQKYLEFKNQGISGVSIGDVSVNLQKYGNSPIALQTLGFYARRFLSRFLRQIIRIARQ